MHQPSRQHRRVRRGPADVRQPGASDLRRLVGTRAEPEEVDMGRIARHVAFAGGIVTAGVLLWARPLQREHHTATAPVVIANRDVAQGSLIDRMAVVVAQWPAGTVPPGAFTAIDSLVGRVARQAIYKGEAVAPGRLMPKGTAPGIGVKITPGKRAFSFRVDDVSWMAREITPNSRVDILAVVEASDGTGKVSKVMMENMRVLAIGVVTTRAEDGRYVPLLVCTVEVTPEEAERLAVATAQFRLRIVPHGFSQ